MTKEQESNDANVWQEMHDKCDEIIVKIVEKKKRRIKKQKQLAATAK